MRRKESLTHRRCLPLQPRKHLLPMLIGRLPRINPTISIVDYHFLFRNFLRRRNKQRTTQNAFLNGRLFNRLYFHICRKTHLRDAA